MNWLTDSRPRAGLAALWVAAGLAAGATVAFAQPMQLPGAAGATPQGTVQPPPPEVPRAPGAGQGGPARASLSLRAIADDAIVGQALMHEGRHSRVVMERVRGGFALRFSMDGYQTTNLLEPCSVSFGEQAVPLESLGRPAGLPRFRLQAPVCPIVFDVLGNAMLVVEPREPCVVEAAQCRLIPRGLWSPDGRGLVALAGELTRQRAAAEAQVREGFRILSERSGPDDKRMVAREQAGFSSEREQICREFNREVNHGFCAVKITEARAHSLKARIDALGRPPGARQ